MTKEITELNKIIKKIGFDPRTKIQYIGPKLTKEEESIVEKVWSSMVNKAKKGLLK